MEVCVTHLTDAAVVEVEEDETVGSLAARVAEQLGLRHGTFSLCRADTPLDDAASVASLGICGGDGLTVAVNERDLAREMLLHHNIEGRVEAQEALREICTHQTLDEEGTSILEWIIQSGDAAHPLHTAATQRSHAVSSCLLRLGCNVNERVAYGDTPLICAARQHDFPICQLLVEHGADVSPENSRGDTALSLCAAEPGAAPVLRLLLHALEEPPSCGPTSNPAEAAHESQATEETALLVAAGKRNESGLLVLCGFYKRHRLDVNYASPLSGCSALVLAVKHGMSRAAVLMLESCGGDPNACDPEGKPVLLWAAMGGDLEVCDALIRHGGRIDATNRSGLTPLFGAVLNSDAAVVSRLLEAGADVNKANRYGTTPLMAAASSSAMSMVMMLVAANADTSPEDANGRTALDAAHDRAIASFLRDKGALPGSNAAGSAE